MKNNEPVELYVSIARTTDAAVLIHCEGREAWLPKSQIRNYNEVEHDGGFMGDIEIPYWLAHNKGLI